MRPVHLIKCGSPLPAGFVPYSFVSQKNHMVQAFVIMDLHTVVETVRIMTDGFLRHQPKYIWMNF